MTSMQKFHKDHNFDTFRVALMHNICFCSALMSEFAPQFEDTRETVHTFTSKIVVSLT